MVTFESWLPIGGMFNIRILVALIGETKNVTRFTDDLLTTCPPEFKLNENFHILI